MMRDIDSIEYQANLTNPRTRERLEAVRWQIEQVGGRLTVHAPQPNGIYVVILYLPASRRPDDFLPGLPFYAV